MCFRMSGFYGTIRISGYMGLCFRWQESGITTSPPRELHTPICRRPPLLPIASVALKPNVKAIYYWICSAAWLTQSCAP